MEPYLLLVHLKLTQHCKLTVIQLKNGLKKEKKSPRSAWAQGLRDAGEEGEVNKGSVEASWQWQGGEIKKSI